MRTSRKDLVEVDSAAVKTLRAAIRSDIFCLARWMAAKLNPLLCANQRFYVAYYDNLWFHDVFLVSWSVGPEQFRSP
jgi:hypothetical protein